LSCKETNKNKTEVKPVNHVVNPVVQQVNNYAMHLYIKLGKNKDSLQKADRLIDSALKIDSMPVFILK
jgi:hypothetical protein